MTDRPTTAIATDEKPFPAVVEKTAQVFDRPLTTLWRRGFRSVSYTHLTLPTNA